ncbi:hypothetical protein M8818_001825 [Zalaria obscura]|uniref:Uncharacterized protein n=1 Tax=Zalaria obscura TaxID=2024903 RepID=A0ACC3SLF7_9PEZI
MRIPIRDTSKEDSYCVTADLLIPGRGEPFKNGCIIVSGTKITHVGAVSEVLKYARLAALPKTHVEVLMPGMWDCHVHLMGIHKVSSAAIVASASQQALAGARSARDVMLLLDAGFTSVREMAGYGIQLDQAISEGSLVGPKIYSSNCIISPTGGHADAHDMLADWFHDAVAHGLPCYTADGVAECLKAVRTQLRAGASVIKICGSGGVGSERDDPIDQQFSDEEIAAMVAEAARARRVVGAHCHGKPGIMASLKAGVRTIEHGSYIDDEAADLMLEKDAVLVATRLIVEDGLKLGEGMFTPIGYQKLLVTAKAQWKAYQLAIKRGVKIAIGTDTGVSIPGGISQGRNGLELGYAVKAGMTPLKAIESCCANGPLTLGPMAPLSGQLKEGYDADFIALSKSPLDDIDVLAHAQNVTHVWRAGKCYKSPGHPVSCI